MLRDRRIALWGVVLLGMMGCQVSVAETDFPQRSTDVGSGTDTGVMDSSQQDTFQEDMGAVVTPPLNLPSTIAFEELDEILAMAYCHKVEHCLLPLESHAALQAGLGEDAALCEAHHAVWMREELRPLQALIEEGTVLYNPDASAECLKEWAEACTISLQLVPWRDGCPNMLKGVIPVGDACRVSQECAGDNHCDAQGLDPKMCMGVCTPRKNLGDACDDASECPKSGLVGYGDCAVNPATGDAICIDARIADERVGVDEPCGPLFNADANTVMWTDCAPGLSCSAVNGEGLCVSPLSIETPCTAGDVCEAGSVCRNEACTPFALAQDEPCNTEEADGSACDAFSGLACINSTCIKFGDGTLGSACRVAAFGGISVPSCHEGLYCDVASSACLERKAVEQACSADVECVSGSCVQGLCAELRCD